MIAPPAPTAASSRSNALSDADSDSDWDSDEDFASKKINIKIKPIAQVTPNKISASVDELRATVGTWKSLANINLVKPNSRRHHQSTLQLNKNINNSNTLNNNTDISPSVEDSPHFGLTATTSVLLPNGLADLEKSFPDIGVDGLAHNRLSLQPTARANGYEFISANQHINSSSQNKQDLILQKPAANDLFGSPPNGILQPQPTPANGFDLAHSSSASAIYSPTLQLAFQNCNINNNNNCENKIRLPVAFAIQECLNAKLINGLEAGGSTDILGRVKLAVPPKIVDIDPNQLEEILVVNLTSKIGYSKILLNHQFVTRSNEQINKSENYIRLNINMLAVQYYARELAASKQINHKHILVPDIVRYMIRSQNKELDESATILNPLPVIAHWFCDLAITKVRVDFPLESLENLLNEFGLARGDIRNLRISMLVSGGVRSYVSKPEANWNPLDSKLTWNLAGLRELMDSSTLNGTTSCLARFNLDDGPTTPSDVDIEFSIVDKTLTGTLVLIDKQSQTNFLLTKQKLEVRTGVYRCEPPCV